MCTCSPLCLQAKKPRVEDWNSRWGTTFTDWGALNPPILHSGDLMGIDTSVAYWDFLKFREESGAQNLDDACRIVVSAGLRCFHHFPEVRAAAWSSTSWLKLVDTICMCSSIRAPRLGRVCAPALLWMPWTLPLLLT
jgi:hypothetical protein